MLSLLATISTPSFWGGSVFSPTFLYLFAYPCFMNDKEITPKDKRRYRIGIDVGRNSTGFCALEIDDDDNPISFLNLSVLLHDAGVGKDGGKTQ